MEITLISDTHGKHNHMTPTLGSGDVIVHCGDVTNNGSRRECVHFLNWFSKLNFTNKIFIPGNHDFFFHDESQDDIEALMKDYPGVTYLCDQEVVVDGIKFYGFPWTPPFGDWCFMAEGDKMLSKLDRIPKDTQILISHGPMYGYGDQMEKHQPLLDPHLGCKLLRNKVLELKDLQVLTFGHIHCSYGDYYFPERRSVRVLNASSANERYVIKNLPIEFTVC